MIITFSYLAVLVAAVVAFAFGALWHSDLALGPTWRKLNEVKEGHTHKGELSPVQSMLIAFIATILFAYVLAHFIAIGGLVVGGVNAGVALEVGFWVWLGFVLVTLAGSWLWEGKSLALFGFNAAYRFIEIMLMALIIGLWH